MVTVDKAVIARLEKNGKHFEVLVEPESAYEYREGKRNSFELAVNEVFSDSKKGLKCSIKDLEHAFNTADVFEVAKEIVKNGEIQITTELRKKKVEEKKRQIASLIAKNAMDPRTKAPHTLERILNAIETVGLSIDPFKSADRQVNDVVEAIRKVLPISMELVKIQVYVPGKVAPMCYGILKPYMKKEEWLNDGSLKAYLEVPAAFKSNLYMRIHKISEDIKVEEI